jgi:hypothetical protein
MTTSSVLSTNVSGVVYYDRISNLASKKSYTKSFAEVKGPNDVYRLTVSPDAKKVYELVAKNAHSLHSRMRPPYFSDYYEYNNNLAMEEAKRVVELAKKDGIELDVNMVYEDVRKWNAIEDEPPAAAWINHEGRETINPYKYLTDEEKAIFEQMHEHAIKNGLSLRQVTTLAGFFALQKHMDDLSNRPSSTIEGFMTDLVDRMKNERYDASGLNISILETFLNNFKIFEDGAKQALFEEGENKA